MKDSFDENESSRSDDHLEHTFGKTEIYLLLVLIVGGVAIDFWFHPPQIRPSMIEQHSAHRPWLL